MNDYTVEEKRAIFKILNLIIIADGKVDVGELLYAKQMINMLKINENDNNASSAMEYSECVSILSKMHESKKESLVMMMTEMVNADGQIDKNELSLITLTSMLIGIPEELFSKHLKRIASK